MMEDSGKNNRESFEDKKNRILNSTLATLKEIKDYDNELSINKYEGTDLNVKGRMFVFGTVQNCIDSLIEQNKIITDPQVILEINNYKDFLKEFTNTKEGFNRMFIKDDIEKLNKVIDTLIVEIERLQKLRK
ncbi:MAG: hypothetical protein WC662_00045 [Candidatus Paceibacterota bacterium]|jgi:hypothetical protein